MFACFVAYIFCVSSVCDLWCDVVWFACCCLLLSVCVFCACICLDVLVGFVCEASCVVV